jgi:hypothetical protein
MDYSLNLRFAFEEAGDAPLEGEHMTSSMLGTIVGGIILYIGLICLTGGITF